MKKTYLFLLFCLLILRGSTNAQNIYESIGKKAEVLTLSNGQYQEIFSNDTLVRIGSVLFNTVTQEVVEFVAKSDADSYVAADVASRFLSVDPIGRQYPELTPYQFASNTPLQAVDLDGLEAYPYFINNTHFITLVNVDFKFVTRQSEKTLTASFPDSPNKTDYSVNTQMYDKTEDASYKTAFTPQPTSKYTPQGLNVENSAIVSGRSSPKTFYFSRDNSGNWTTGQGDVPSDSNFGFGGGTPLIVSGLKYGTTNIFSKQIEGTSSTGPVSPEYQQYLLQKSNGVYTKQNESTLGKTILAYRSKDRLFKLISQENGTSGYTLDQIRDQLHSDGFDHVLGFDGSNSSTLVKDGTTVVNPALQKNNTMPSGVNLSVPEDKKQ